MKWKAEFQSLLFPKFPFLPLHGGHAQELGRHESRGQARGGGAGARWLPLTHSWKAPGTHVVSTLHLSSEKPVSKFAFQVHNLHRYGAGAEDIKKKSQGFGWSYRSRRTKASWWRQESVGTGRDGRRDGTGR
jgi:hypothetical protein